MPQVYDPTNGSMFRSRRRRKRKIANPKMVVVGSAESSTSVPPTTTSIKDTSIKEPLKSGDHLDFENCKDDVIVSLTSPKVDNRIDSTRRKQKVCLLSNDAMVKKITLIEPVTIKRRTGDLLCETSRAAPLSPLASFTGTTASRAKHVGTTSPENFFQYAIAFDTRYLNTQVGTDDQEDFQQGVRHFLRTIFCRRGFSPSVVTWTECGSRHDVALSDCSLDPGISNTTIHKKLTNNRHTTTRKDLDLHTSNESEDRSSCSRSNIRILSKHLKDDNVDEILLSINGSPIQPPISDKNVFNRIVTPLPKELIANSTWNVFGDLVKATVDHFNPSYPPLAFRAPLKIVIFTSAASILLDINSASHIRGIDDFWDRSRCHFLKSKVQSVEIVVVMGETVVDRITKDRCGIVCGNVRLSNIIDNEESGIKEESESDQIGHKRVNASNRESNGSHHYDANIDTTNSSLIESLGKQAGVIKTMQRYIETKVEADLKINHSRQQLDSKVVENQSRMKISLSVVDSAFDYHSLCQKWSRDSMHTATSGNCSQPSPKISFQLPETTNFEAYDVSFKTHYKNMPFRVDSLQAKQLYADLKLLSKASLKVLQLVPFSSIDASLIYGVTIGLRADNEDGEERHHEKTFLVQSLFNNLATRDCALLLRSTNYPCIEKTNFRDRITKANGDDGLFHSSEESQYFLFMPEFVLSQDGPAAPKSGILRRIASVDHILEESCAWDILNSVNSKYAEAGKKSKLTENPFSEYLEASLDSLKCSPMNPWIQDRLNNSISSSSAIRYKLNPPDGKETVSTFNEKKNRAKMNSGYSTSPDSESNNSNFSCSSSSENSFGTFCYGT